MCCLQEPEPPPGPSSQSHPCSSTRPLRHGVSLLSFIHSSWSHHTVLRVLLLKHAGGLADPLPSTVSWLILSSLLNFVQTSPSQTGLLRPTCLGCIQPTLIPTPLCFTFLLLYQHLTSLLPIIILFIVFLPSVK